MKIIELLNKIANGEEVPKRIKYENDIYILLDNYCYFCEETNEILSQNIYAEFSRLNDEVEIIEDKKIEKFKDYIPIGLTSVGADFRKKDVFEALLKIGDKINEIIDKLNKEE